jgi:hypothetical protein
LNNSKQILSWIDEAISLWRINNVKLQDGVLLIKITEFEKRLGFKFPLDFLELYQKVNGFEDFEWDKNMFSLWSLDRILKEYQEDADNNCVGFCDYLISSHTIGFSKFDNQIYKYYSKPELIASTFKEAIGLLNSNSELLY